MHYRRTAIEIESPEQLGYDTITNNLSESSFADMSLSSYGIDGNVGELLLPYPDHLGLDRLRVLVAEETLSRDDVIVTAGAAAALFIVATSLLEPGAHVLACAPNYVTNLETPRALDAELEPLELSFASQWRLDVSEVARRLRPSTRLVSVTYPHNPTGATIDIDDLHRLVAIVERHPQARLLVDETYRELAYRDPLPLAASLSPRVIGVSSMSKTYGLPGLRVGWLTCRDPVLMETFLAAKEQIFIAGSVIDEEMAARVLERRAEVLRRVKSVVADHLAIVTSWIEQSRVFDWVAPQAGVVAFLRFQEQVEVDVDRFYASLLQDHGTYVGPGHWFDQDRRFFRVGFAWPETAELERGLEALERAATSAQSERARVSR